jgi:hypothetical protein
MNDDAQIMRLLGAHRDVVGQAASPAGHFDVDMLARHATGQLSAAKARAVSEHLLVCDDGRCVAFVRANAEDVDAAAALLYPAEEAEMHARTFLCREALWQAFEEIAREQGAPIDDVLSDAMRSYARQRSYGAETVNPGYPGGGAHDYDAENAPDLARTGAVRQPTQRFQGPTGEAPAMRRGGMPAPPPSRSSGVGMPPPPPMSARGGAMQRPFTQPISQQLPAPPQRGRPMPGAAQPPMRAPMPQSRSVPPPPRSVPPPLPPSDPMMPAGAPMYGSARGRAAATLTLSYNGRHLDVTKERFILGRSKTQADLVLEDPNVSRQHAAIERVGNEWILADLGSTNGCYIDGQRVSRRPIADGDVIEITTHQVHCTLR